MGAPVVWLLTDPADPKEVERLNEVCKGVAKVSGDTLDSHNWTFWFIPVAIEAAGVDVNEPYPFPDEPIESEELEKE